ncbi:hypothetical protein O4H61_09325 [Roseovarius aestuarii]|nr:hypothetical protein [Roseovarius aestuarii]
MKKPGIADYPMAETQGKAVCGPRGVALDQITLDAVMDGSIGIDDLRITRAALHAQADIARDAGRAALAQNFERGAELIDVPQDVIMQTYEMLRPGRVQSKQALLDQADMLRRDYGAEQIADFLARAAEIYHRRGLFPKD